MPVRERRTERQEMITTQLVRRGITDLRLLQAFMDVPRHLFVPPEAQPLAYADQALAIGYAQTISQPYIVALMTALLNLHGGEQVLEVGSGSGYQTALLSRLSGFVHSLELLSPLAEGARARLFRLRIFNAAVHCADGGCGWPYGAPYDAVLLTAAGEAPPPPLLAQLSNRGRLVMPRGGRWGQTLEVWERKAQGYARRQIESVRFVPLRGAYGWNEKDWPAEAE